MSEEKKWTEIPVGDIPIHDFEKEQELIGVLIKVEREVGPNKSTMYTLEKENKEKVKVWGSTVIDSRMESIRIGEEVKIYFVGRSKNPKTNRVFKDFKVYKVNFVINGEKKK